MGVTSKCVESEHRAEIDQAAQNGMSARQISEMLTVKYAETISHTSINNYLAKGKSIAQEAESKAITALKARVRNLEVNAWISRASGSDWGTSVYNIHGETSYKLKREDVLLRAIPHSELLESEYKATVNVLKQEIRDEHPDNLDASIWEEARAVRLEWAEEDRKQEEKAAEQRALKNAELELLEREKQATLLQKSIEKTAKKMERERRLQKLRDAELEKNAGIDENGDPIAVT